MLVLTTLNDCRAFETSAVMETPERSYEHPDPDAVLDSFPWMKRGSSPKTALDKPPKAPQADSSRQTVREVVLFVISRKACNALLDRELLASTTLIPWVRLHHVSLPELTIPLLAANLTSHRHAHRCCPAGP